MHYRSLLKNGAIVIVAGMLTLTACKRNKTTTTVTTPTLTNVDDNGGYATDAAKLEESNNDVISLADAAASSGGADLRTTASCATVTKDTVLRKITISFGSTGCVGADGKTRKGDIIVTYTGKYKDSGSVHSISYNNFFVQGVQRTGSKTVTNKGTNSSGQVWYTVIVNDTLILASDSIISWTGNRTRTWTAGYSTALRSDDVYEIGGVTTLKRANGKVFTHTISSTAPLKVAQSCAYIQSGIVTVSSSSFTGGDRTLDYSYGGGGCDNQAQLTVAGKTYVITMR